MKCWHDQHLIELIEQPRDLSSRYGADSLERHALTQPAILQVLGAQIACQFGCGSRL